MLIENNILKKAYESDFKVIDGDIGGIIVPDNITEIADEAFKYLYVNYNTSSNTCKYFKIIIPDSVTKIGKDAFRGCNVFEIDIGKNLNYLGEGAFSYCTNLEIIYFNGDKLKEIKDKTFYDCRKLRYLIQYNYIEDDNVSPSPFLGSSIKINIRIDDDSNIIFLPYIKKIGNSAFKNCYAAENFIINKSVNFIGEYAFSGCVKLRNLRLLTENIEIIIPGEFKNQFLNYLSFMQYNSDEFRISDCYDLKNLDFVFFPIENIKCIPKGCFSYCYNIRFFMFYNEHLEWDINLAGKQKEVLWGGSSNVIETAPFYKQIIKIDDYAFIDCMRLQAIGFVGYYRLDIGKFSFKNCSNLLGFLKRFISKEELINRIEIRNDIYSDVNDRFCNIFTEGTLSSIITDDRILMEYLNDPFTIIRDVIPLSDFVLHKKNSNDDLTIPKYDMVKNDFYKLNLNYDNYNSNDNIYDISNRISNYGNISEENLSLEELREIANNFNTVFIYKLGVASFHSCLKFYTANNLILNIMEIDDEDVINTRRIPSYCFANCVSLTEFKSDCYFYNNVKQKMGGYTGRILFIGYRSFINDYNLNYIGIFNVVTIEEEAFRYNKVCGSIDYLRVFSVGNYAFYNFDNLHLVEIPINVTRMNGSYYYSFKRTDGGNFSTTKNPNTQYGETGQQKIVRTTNSNGEYEYKYYFYVNKRNWEYQFDYPTDEFYPEYNGYYLTS